jgi:hypothetical protein
MFMRSLFKFMRRWENVDSINVAQNRDDMAVVNTFCIHTMSRICGLAEDLVNSLILLC